MTTLAAARSALVTAVGASDSMADPPATYVYSQGSDMTRLGGTGVEWRFRVSCVVGYQGDDATAEGALFSLLTSKLAILNPLAGWAIDRVSPSLVTDIGGGKYYSADIDVSTVVHL